MKQLLSIVLVVFHAGRSRCFWDLGTTTPDPPNYREEQRTAFFHWPYCEPKYWFGHISKRPGGWTRENLIKFQTYAAAGVSIDFLPIGVAAILNRRILVTSANPLDQYMNRQEDVRVWGGGGIAGRYNTPYRYRVHQIRRVLPRSLNPEHQIGPKATFCSRHDIAVIFTADLMFLYYQQELTRYVHSIWASLPAKTEVFHKNDPVIEIGTGFYSMDHVKSNFKIQWATRQEQSFIVNCERYLPKWWGKFICFKGRHASRAGVQNGALLMVGYLKLIGLGAFEIRYNEDWVGVYTDLRYYVDWIKILGNFTRGEYYDYAYQQFGVRPGYYDWNANANEDFFPFQYRWYGKMWPVR